MRTPKVTELCMVLYFVPRRHSQQLYPCPRLRTHAFCLLLALSKARVCLGPDSERVAYGVIQKARGTPGRDLRISPAADL